MLKHFLIGRGKRTRVNNNLSKEREIPKGVPKDSAISPLLFNVMLADFPIPEDGCETSLFADDIAIYSTEKNKGDTTVPLQQQLDKIEEWAIKWNFKFSISKCASLKFTKKGNKDRPQQFKLNGATISKVTHYKFLGIIMDHKLSCEPQIQAITNKILSQQRANLIRMMTYGKNTLKIPLLIRIFKAMIRSAYDYTDLPFLQPSQRQDWINSNKHKTKSSTQSSAASNLPPKHY